MARGGARPNTGPKKGVSYKKTIEQKVQRELLNKKIDAKWGEIMDAQINEALKNYKAGQYLIDQRVGRPKEEIEVSGGINLTIDF